MARIRVDRKRPCRVCGRWYQPSSRLRKRQKTCGAKACMQEWHRRVCRRWNRQNRQDSMITYLASKLEAAAAPAGGKPTPRAPPRGVSRRWPRQVLEQELGIRKAVLVDYVAHKVVRDVQEVMRP